MTQEEIKAYFACFNEKRFDDVADYFAEDVTVTYPRAFKIGAPPAKVLHGKQQFIDNYKALTEKLEEVIDLEAVITDETHIFVVLHTEFHPKVDVDNFSAGVLKKGVPLVVTDFVLYELNDEGKFQNISIAHHNVEGPEAVRH
jgi:hypothetical protein